MISYGSDLKVFISHYQDDSAIAGQVESFLKVGRHVDENISIQLGSF